MLTERSRQDNVLDKSLETLGVQEQLGRSKDPRERGGDGIN